jgi:hypothetical protein
MLWVASDCYSTPLTSNCHNDRVPWSCSDLTEISSDLFLRPTNFGAYVASCAEAGAPRDPPLSPRHDAASTP